MNKKRMPQKLCSRAFITSAAVIAQLMILALPLWLGTRHLPAVSLALRLLGVLAVIHVTSAHTNPVYKLAWVTLILLIPQLGGAVYLAVGNKRLTRGFKKRLNDYFERSIRPLECDSGEAAARFNAYGQGSLTAGYLKRCTGLPVWQDTACEFFPSGSELFKRLCDELLTAERFIFMEYFIITPGELWSRIEAILAEKCRAGVTVRLMYDDIGTISTLPRGFDERLRALGIELVVFNPCRPHISAAMNYRDHRKICVIDGNVGFCGGANIADEYVNRASPCGHWKDTGVMLCGSGVWNLTLLFLTLWGLAVGGELDDPTKYTPTITAPSDGFVQAFGDSPLDNICVTESVYLMSIARAARYIYITTPYLVLGHEMIKALTTAALCGVDVRIITPGVPDKGYVHTMTRSYYSELLKCGVRIFEYSPGFIHAKQLVCDDSLAVVGTANLDFRSFYLHFECAVCMYGCSAVADVKRDIEATLCCCREITLRDVSLFPLRQRLAASLLRLFAPLF